MEASPEAVRNIDHKQRQVHRVGDAGWCDIHKVFKAPVLFGITEVELQLEPQAIIVHEGGIGQSEITAE